MSAAGEGLEARGLRKVLGGRTVVASLGLHVRPGEVVGLLGPNGAGKTTTFRMLAGLLAPDAGEVLLDGQRLTGLRLWERVRRGLGYLPQEPSVFRRLSVADNVAVALEGSGRGGGEVAGILAEAGLAALAGQPAGRLSGGERRRLELARCLAAAPRIVLLDEPFSGVDPVAVSELQGRIRALAERGIGVLLTDHAVREALGSCDRALILDAGEVMAQGTPEVVAAHAHARARYLGADFELPPRRKGT